VSKGELTRQVILEHAASLASKLGLEALSIGKLADDLALSKSGLFAHFKSKEALQVQLLEFTSERFIELVVRPALRAPRGEPRVREVFERWRAWPDQVGMSGCLLVQVSTELDDRPGPVRDVLVRMMRDWLDTISGVARSAVAEGHFGPQVDGEQFAFELWGLMLGYHHCSRLLADPRAEERARVGFEALLARSRA
jgi:AcrR family transcriptional regulator